MMDINTINEFVGFRKVAVKALVGSWNYNLNTPVSDYDYKYFVFPNFDDLYESKHYAHCVVTPTLDQTAHDVRKLVDLIWKANVNFMEVLFSADRENVSEFEFLFDHREEYAQMNLWGFYKATYGMHLEKMNGLFRGTSNTQHLVTDFGYDTKQACHAYRCLDLISRFMERGNMADTLWYEEGHARNWLLNVKAGKVTLDEFKATVQNWHDHNATKAEKFFKATVQNVDLYNYAQSELKEAVRKNLVP